MTLHIINEDEYVLKGLSKVWRTYIDKYANICVNFIELDYLQHCRKEVRIVTTLEQYTKKNEISDILDLILEDLECDYEDLHR